MKFLKKKKIGNQKKIGKVMGEWKKGKLKSSSGAKVTDKKEAIAIAISMSQRKK